MNLLRRCDRSRRMQGFFEAAPRRPTAFLHSLRHGSQWGTHPVGQAHLAHGTALGLEADAGGRYEAHALRGFAAPKPPRACRTTG